MARTIISPGVQISERDLSSRLVTSPGTNVFVTGFTTSGPTDEVLHITSMQEYANIYGNPTTPAERYLYYSVEPMVTAGANVFVSRMPYGGGSGAGFGSLYGALVYPAKVVTPDTQTGALSVVGTDLAALSATYVLGRPRYFNLTKDQYLAATDGTGFSWSSVASGAEEMTGVSSFGSAAVVVLNKVQSTINTRFEGYYIGLADNSNLNPATDFDAALSVFTRAQSAGTTGATTFTQIPQTRLAFTLSGTNGSNGTLSETMEKIADFDISPQKYNDVVSMGVYKLRQSIFSPETTQLDFVLEEKVDGSFDYHRQIGNRNGGSADTYFIGNVAESDSRNVIVMVNDNVSNRTSTTWLNNDGIPTKNVRLLTRQLEAQLNTSSIYSQVSSTIGLAPAALTSLQSALGYADSLFPIGAYSNESFKDKDLGSIPNKLDRILSLVDNDELFDIDITVEAGLGTIYAVASANGSRFYDDTAGSAGLTTGLAALATTLAYSAPANSAHDLRGNYNTIFSKFQQFAEVTRKDHLFIADTLRHILVQGANTKVVNDENKNWSQHIFSPIRHQFELANTSYSCMYANWARVNDDFTQTNMWVPFSGHVGAAMARTDSDFDPWWAPAGSTRGRIFGVDDLAIEPNQKQRDDFYKFAINPIARFPKEGIVIYGQKTLLKQPSAFDRINVRRLFLHLEKITKGTARYFVFEPNTLFTRTRIKDDLRPAFDRAKNNQGVYDYIIVCDERNNTPDVIDANELVVDIYIKAVRSAEFILVNFKATRTGANFDELIG